MKKVIVVLSLLAVLFLSMCSTGFASELNWRINIKADNGAGMSSSSAQLGILAGKKDPQPTDALPLSDAGTDSPWVAAVSTLKTVATVFPLDTAGLVKKAWAVDIKSANQPWNDQYFDPDYPPYKHRKVWPLRVAGCGMAITSTPIRLQFLTVGAMVLPSKLLTYSAGPPVVTVGNRFWLKMVDNKGKEGAPANGKVWAIPIPTSHTTISFFTITLPTINITVNTSMDKLIEEGYVMEFYQTPEPSSLLALGAGLMGLAGFASKRRRG